jgi:hypothetical protein
MDDRTLRGAPILTLTSTEGDIDVMDRIAGVGPYADVRKHSERISALGVSFRVLDLPSLIKAKRAAGRPCDFEHLPELEACYFLARLIARSSTTSSSSFGRPAASFERIMSSRDAARKRTPNASNRSAPAARSS